MTRGMSALLFLFLSVILLLTFLSSSGLALLILPDALKLQVLMGQVCGLLLPALALQLWLSQQGLSVAVIPPPRTEPGRLAFGVAAVTATSILFSFALATAWMNWLRTRGWDWVAPFVEFAKESEVLFEADGLLAKLLTLALVTLVPGLCEELVFRRLLLGVLLKAHAPALALGLSALMFAAFHGDPLGFPHRFFLGVSLGLIYYRTSSLLACAASHAAFNAVVAVPALLLDLPEAAAPVQFELSTWLGLLVVGLFALAAWWTTTLLLPRPARQAETRRSPDLDLPLTAQEESDTP